MNRYRTGWISDVHLGTHGSQAEALLQFLRTHEFETLYVVGDLIDVWSLRRGIYWPQAHNDIIQKLLRAGRKGTRIFYIPGNHDEFVSGFLVVMAQSQWPLAPFIPRRMGGACSSFTVTSWTP